MSLYSYAKKSDYTQKQFKEISLNRLLNRILATVFSLFIFLLTSFLLNRISNQSISPATIQSLSSEPVNKSSKLPTRLAETSTSRAGKLSEAILGESTYLSPYSYLSPTITPTPYQLALASSIASDKPFTAKKLYTIAIYGDSMVDTMGEVLEYLDAELKKKYPNSKFLLYNYGKGAENVEMGLNRLTSPLKYQSRDYQSIPELKPDVLIVGSFAYNPFTPHDRDKHWLTLTKLVQTAKLYTPRVYMLAEIAPLRQDFGKGPQGVNWSDDTNYEHSLRIIHQLENALGLARTLNIPVIDAFTPSFHSEDRIGKREYVNPADGIHPSVAGHQFMAEKIAAVIKLN